MGIVQLQIRLAGSVTLNGWDLLLVCFGGRRSSIDPVPTGDCSDTICTSYSGRVLLLLSTVARDSQTEARDIGHQRLAIAQKPT
jgi:hypothetical protein